MSQVNEPCRECGNGPPHEWRGLQDNHVAEIVCKDCRALVDRHPTLSLPQVVADLLSVNI